MLVELLFLLIGLLFYSHYKKRLSLPPGPPSVPILGTLSALSTEIVHLVSQKEFYKYEDMYTLFLGPVTTIVVINDLQRAKDLFSKDEFSGNFFLNLSY